MAYIAECFSAGRGRDGDGRTLGVAALLYKPEAKTYKQNNYSRFVFSINQNKTSIKANLKLDERALLIKKYQFSVETLIKNSMKKRNGNSPAFTVELTGVYKGKTVAQILSGSTPEAEVDKLTHTQKWLEDNLSAYPANQRMIDAIKDGLYLYKSGKLKSDTPAPAFPLFEGERKYFTTQKDGKNLCYSLTILFNAGMNLPYRIIISNFWAPIVKNTLEYSKATDIVEKRFDLTEKEMAMLMSQMQFAADCFMQLHGAEICKEVVID